MSNGIRSRFLAPVRTNQPVDSILEGVQGGIESILVAAMTPANGDESSDRPSGQLPN